MDYPLAVGHVLLSVNGSPVTGCTTEDGRDVFELIEKKVCSTEATCPSHHYFSQTFWTYHSHLGEL